jgi:RimJ/RimL family protein N-acetyltransferase
LIALAPIEPEHLPNFVRWSRDPRGMRYLGMTRPLTMADEEQWYQRTNASETDVVWAILRDGQIIGNAGLHTIDWRNRNAVSGIWIGDTAQHGKGYGGETMRLRTAYAFRELGLEKVMTMIFSDNDSSRRAAERAGYRQCGLRRRHVYRDGRWLDQWLGEVLREEWLALQATA